MSSTKTEAGSLLRPDRADRSRHMIYWPLVTAGVAVILVFGSLMAHQRNNLIHQTPAEKLVPIEQVADDLVEHRLNIQPHPVIDKEIEHINEKLDEILEILKR